MTKSPLTTKIELDVDQVFALSYALAVAALSAKTRNDPKLIKVLKSIDSIVEDRIEALG